MTDSKKHHYVPQSLLKQFRIANSSSQIYVYDKNRKSSFKSSIRDAGSENHFNTFMNADQRINFESVFQKNDDRLAQLIDVLTTDEHTNRLNTQDRSDLLHIISAQIVRTKIHRTSMLSVAEQMIDSLKDAGFDKDELLNFSIPSEDEVRQFALSSYLKSDELVESISGKVGFLIRCDSGNSFWTSDNPVVLHNTFPYGDVALGAAGIEIYFPISSKLALGFYCPSIFSKMKYLLSSNYADVDKELYSSMLSALKNGEAISLGPKTATFINSLQVLQSTRFIYSASNADFSLVDSILEENPDASNIQTKIKVGKLGMGPEPRKRMPSGIWLAVYSSDNHYLLPISNFTDAYGVLEFETDALTEIGLILKSSRIDRVILFDDGAERRGMRDVKFETEYSGSTVHVKVSHKNEALNSILKNL